MNNEPHTDLFGGETPIVEGNDRDQGSGQPRHIGYLLLSILQR